DFDDAGFAWIDSLDHDNSVLSFLRRDAEGGSQLAVILNLTPVPRSKYRLGLPRPGKWAEVLNSDAAIYGGGNIGHFGGVPSEEFESHTPPCSAQFPLPPLGIIAFRPEPCREPQTEAPESAALPEP